MKKFLLSLCLGFVGLIGFGFCDNAYIFSNVSNSSNYFGPGDCWLKNNQAWRDLGVKAYNLSGDLIRDYSSDSSSTYVTMYCMDFSGYLLQSDGTPYSVTNWTRWNVSSLFPTCPECETCPSLSGYILESEIDTNYCVGNGYCPNECGSGTDLSGDLQYSNLYINNILHPGTQNIFVDIPDYITWDYATTGDDFNIYVGSGYDLDYINSIIDINSYRPDSEDFTNVFVSGLTLVFPYIIVALFILFVWKLLKRVFK